MSSPTAQADAPLLDTAAWLSPAAFVTGVLAALGGLVNVASAGAGGLDLVGVPLHEQAPIVLNRIGLAAVTSLPLWIAAALMFDVHRVFKRVGQGELFTARTVKSIGRLGSGVMWIVAAQSLITPMVAGWISEPDAPALAIRLGPVEMSLFVVGAALMGIAHVMRLAVDLKAENDQFV